ncbi:hypothetical protein LCGC14_1534700 [marine sediment metagenome]|uniref:Uncharacterized protein n=1 Tax=marine sediment metagenome TaxID=412755 RepID=A0A0F9IUW5_9ZZZZ
MTWYSCKYVMKAIGKALHWLWDHFGWGYFGWNKGNLPKQRINPSRQEIRAYCKEFGLTRKAAKKGLRRAKMWRKNWAAIRKARYDGWKAGTLR